jgi:hypothetical protein
MGWVENYEPVLYLLQPWPPNTQEIKGSRGKMMKNIFYTKLKFQNRFNAP